MPEPRLIPIVELTMVRLREFLREPEAVFWVFAFPLLMAFALGIAFRDERAQEVVVGVVRAEGSTIGQQLKDAEGVRVRPLEPDEVDGALRRGQVAVVLIPGPPLVYRFDPARPESRMAGSWSTTCCSARPDASRRSPPATTTSWRRARATSTG